MGEINPPHHTAEEIEEALKKLSEIGIELHEIQNHDKISIWCRNGWLYIGICKSVNL